MGVRGGLTQAAEFTCLLGACACWHGDPVRRVCNSPSTQVGSGRGSRGLGIASHMDRFQNANIHLSASAV